MNDLVINKSPEARVADLIYQVNGTLPSDIKLHDSLIHDLAMDSVELVDLFMRLEEFGVIIAEADINSRLTVADIVKRLRETT